MSAFGRQQLQCTVASNVHLSASCQLRWAGAIKKLGQARGNPMLNFIDSSKLTRMSKVIGTDFIAIASHNG
ncbi:hypothetical protein ASD07_29580 [Duganella sp. Root336D2]|nr:hypothetical protein ASD07_29580 [Duganella sp. Root336D2]